MARARHASTGSIRSPRPRLRFPPTRRASLARGLVATGKLPLFTAATIDHQTPLKAPPPAGVTAEYGRYLAVGCRGCHGKGLSGGPVPGAPPSFVPARDITPAGIGDWEEQDFFRVMRE